MFGRIASDTDFHRWLDTAIRRNLGTVAADEYYQSRAETGRFDSYTVVVDGNRVQFPLYTTNGWREYEGDINDIIEGDVGTIESENREDLTMAIANQLAYRNGEDIRDNDVDVRDYLWDGAVYTPVSGSPDQPRFEMRETNYFSHLSTGERLAWELYESLYTEGVSANAERDALESAWEPSLPYRQRVAGSLEDGVGSETIHSLFGVASMVAINDGEGYQVPFLWRDPQLTASPAQYGLVGGLFDPNSDGLREQMLREVVEELLGGDEGDAASSHPLGRQFVNALYDGRASLDYLRTAIDPKWMNHHVRLLFVIDDIELGRQILENYEINFETEHVKFVDVTSDSDWIRRMASVETLSPMAAPCVFDGMNRLVEEYGATSPVDFHIETE